MRPGSDPGTYVASVAWPALAGVLAAPADAALPAPASAEEVAKDLRRVAEAVEFWMAQAAQAERAFDASGAAADLDACLGLAMRALQATRAHVAPLDVEVRVHLEVARISMLRFEHRAEQPDLTRAVLLLDEVLQRLPMTDPRRPLALMNAAGARSRSRRRPCASSRRAHRCSRTGSSSSARCAPGCSPTRSGPRPRARPARTQRLARPPQQRAGAGERRGADRARPAGAPPRRRPAGRPLRLRVPHPLHRWPERPPLCWPEWRHPPQPPFGPT